jgi:hypothetical protein
MIEGVVVEFLYLSQGKHFLSFEFSNSIFFAFSSLISLSVSLHVIMLYASRV